MVHQHKKALGLFIGLSLLIATGGMVGCGPSQQIPAYKYQFSISQPTEIPQDWPQRLEVIALAYEHLRGALALNPIKMENVKNTELQRSVIAAIEQSGAKHWLTQEEFDQITRLDGLDEWRWFLSGNRASLGNDLWAVISSRQALWSAAKRKGVPAALSWRPGSFVPEESVPNMIMSSPEQTVLTIALKALANLGDVHMSYLSPVEQDAFLDRFASEGNHVGLELLQREGVVKVSKLIEGGPAFSSGLAVGDIIKEIISFDEKNNPSNFKVSDHHFDDLLGALKGKEGTKVVLKVMRDDKEVTVNLIRKAFIPSENRVRMTRLSEDWFKLTIPFLYDEMKVSDNGVVGSSAQHVKEVMSALPEGAHLIVDLRQNTGGSLEEAVKIMGLLRGKEAYVQTLSASMGTTLRGSEPQIWSGDIAVWVGPQTMSSAEVLALGLYDTPGVKVIGWQTYGKGTIQRRVQLDPAAVREGKAPRYGELWVTTAWVLKDGYHLQKEGVPVNIPLANPIQEPWGERQEERALERINAEGGLKFDSKSELEGDVWATSVTPYQILQEDAEWLDITQHAFNWKDVP